MKTKTLIVATAGTLLCAAAFAQKLSNADQDFMRKAAHNGHTEVEGSKLALSKAATPEVKKFAEQMVADHTKAGDELTQLAQSKGVTLPTEPSVTQKGELKVLSAFDGDRFDRTYAQRIGVKAHEDTVKLFKKGAAEAKDADVKAFAQKTLPTLEHHLEMAKALKTTTDAKAN